MSTYETNKKYWLLMPRSLAELYSKWEYGGDGRKDYKAYNEKKQHIVIVNSRDTIDDCRELAKRINQAIAFMQGKSGEHSFSNVTFEVRKKNDALYHRYI